MNKGEQKHRKELWILTAAVFLTSFSLITFEITLSRLLSVLLSYHYVFIVLSLTLLGLGAGGISVYFFRSRISREQGRSIFLTFFASLYALSVSFSIVCLIRLGYLGNILFYCLLLFIPFLFAGMLLATIYSRFPGASARIYGMDLIGGAAGSIGIVPLLDLLGGISAGLLLGLIASVAALLFTLAEKESGKKEWLLSAGSSFILALLWMGNLVGFFVPAMPIGENPDKEIHDVLSASSSHGKIIETRWSAFGRTDLVSLGKDADHMDLYIDGTAGSPMYQFNGNLDHPDPAINALKTSFPGYLPLLHLREHEKDHVLIIGPGGGRDVLLALMAGFRKITAVEVNRDLTDIVRKYSAYNGGIYTDTSRVSMVVDEGRHYLKQREERYDMILLCLPVTHTSRSLEGYALTENFLFTTGSIHDYIDHLTEEGRLVVVGHNDAEILRLLSISLRALDRRGVGTTEAMKRVYLLGSDLYPVFVLKKAVFEATEMLVTFQAMGQFDLEPKTSYLPSIGRAAALNPALARLASGEVTLEHFIRMVKERGYDISPVSDDSPFFYKIGRGIPDSISLVFWLSIIIWLLIVLVPLLIWKEKTNRGRKGSNGGKGVALAGFKSVVFFSMLGMGFMLIEISFIQRLTLFLGHPTLSLALLLFSLLGWAGLGSLWSGRFVAERIRKVIFLSSLAVVVLLFLYAFLLPLLLDQLLGLTLPFRALTTNLILAPLGLAVGMPFPLGIRSLKERGMGNHIPWMWGVNGSASVLGSTMTILIAISLGFTQALLASACCYLIVFLIHPKRS
jgi:predicted membrane-bound spermidine synthase